MFVMKYILQSKDMHSEIGEMYHTVTGSLEVVLAQYTGPQASAWFLIHARKQLLPEKTSAVLCICLA